MNTSMTIYVRADTRPAVTLELATIAERDMWRDRAEAAKRRVAELEGALTDFRNITPGAMVALMALGREGLLLADKLHKADDIARAALDQIKGAM